VPSRIKRDRHGVFPNFSAESIGIVVARRHIAFYKLKGGHIAGAIAFEPELDHLAVGYVIALFGKQVAYGETPPNISYTLDPGTAHATSMAVFLSGLSV